MIHLSHGIVTVGESHWLLMLSDAQCSAQRVCKAAELVSPHAAGQRVPWEDLALSRLPTGNGS